MILLFIPFNVEQHLLDLKKKKKVFNILIKHKLKIKILKNVIFL